MVRKEKHQRTADIYCHLLQYMGLGYKYLDLIRFYGPGYSTWKMFNKSMIKYISK